GGSRTIVLMLTSYQMTGQVTAARTWKQSERTKPPVSRQLGPLAAEPDLSFGRSRLAIGFVGALSRKRNRGFFVERRMARGVVHPDRQGIAGEGSGAVAGGCGHLIEEPIAAGEGSGRRAGWWRARDGAGRRVGVDPGLYLGRRIPSAVA